MPGTALHPARWLKAIVPIVILCALSGSGPAWARSNCSGTSVGLVPIDDLGAGTYQSFQGGLYPGGANARPASHDLAADGAARVALLDPNGAPSPSPAGSSF